VIAIVELIGGIGILLSKSGAALSESTAAC
jgi:hypothetical protein